jgi:hypothetical protein
MKGDQSGHVRCGRKAAEVKMGPSDATLVSVFRRKVGFVQLLIQGTHSRQVTLGRWAFTLIICKKHAEKRNFASSHSHPPPPNVTLGTSGLIINPQPQRPLLVTFINNSEISQLV